MNLRAVAFGLATVLGLSVFALACGGDGKEAEPTPTPAPEGTVPPAQTPTPTPAPEPMTPPEVTTVTRYEVTVDFNRSYAEDDIDEVAALLGTYDDDDLEGSFCLERFPPICTFIVDTDAPDFCATVGAELEAKSYIDSISCGPPPSGEPTGDGEVSVTNVPSMGSVAPDTFLTFEGGRYRAVDVIQASLVAEAEFQEIGVATEADIDYEGELKVYRHQGDAAAVYTFSPPIDVEGEEGDVPALWIRWEPEA